MKYQTIDQLKVMETGWFISPDLPRLDHLDYYVGERSTAGCVLHVRGSIWDSRGPHKIAFAGSLLLAEDERTPTHDLCYLGSFTSKKADYLAVAVMMALSEFAGEFVSEELTKAKAIC